MLPAMEGVEALRALGVSTVYEAGGREGLVDVPLTRLVPDSRAAGPARTVRCGQDDNLMVHAVMAEAQPGEVLVLTMPEPRPVALVGDILGLQARVRGVAAVLVDAACRDADELRELGLPIWCRYVRSTGAAKATPGVLNEPVMVGGVWINPGDIVVLDGDGAVVVRPDRLDEVVAASRARATREEQLRDRLLRGELTYDVHGLRRVVEGG